MNIIKGIYEIIKLKKLTKKQKAMAIGYGMVETILNAPKNILSLIPLAIGAIFGALGELCEIISTPLLEFANWLKWDTKDLTIAPKEFRNEFTQAIKDELREEREKRYIAKVK